MDLKEMVKSRQRTLIYGAVALLVCALVFFSFGQPLLDQWPSEGKIQETAEKLKKRQLELQLEINRHNVLASKRDAYVKNSPLFWIDRRDGNPETKAQERIEDAAKAAGLQLNTIGRVQVSKIIDGLSYCDTSVQATAPVEQIMGFIEHIYKKYPRFYWASITLSPDNIKNPQKLVMNGNLRFISISDEDIVKKILGDKDEKKKN